MTTKVTIAIDENKRILPMELAMANRHGLITGATGTGKTVTLQKIAEEFSKKGIPVFTADVKGDLSGIAKPGGDNPKVKERLKELHLTNFTPHGNPVVFWDVYGKNGHPLRTTISEMGPLMLGRILRLNEVQQGVLTAVFSVADDQGLLLLDLKDLQSILVWAKENSKSLQGTYGNITASTVGAIQRGLLTLAESGGVDFFGEPTFDLNDLFAVENGKGVINLLDATQLVHDSLLYSTFLLWMLSALYEKMPEIGDVGQPKLVFFFDEAHLLFNTAPKMLLEKIEQLVRLIRSKGIGVYFVTQNPLDVPETILGQLGNRIQHALRGFTPKDQKAIRAAAETFRQNPKLNASKVISELGVGEALISFLNEKGMPSVVERAKIIPPSSRIGALSPTEKENLISSSPLNYKYEKIIDRVSAYETLEKLAKQKELVTESAQAKSSGRSPGRPRQSATEAIIVSTARSFGTQLGRQIIRGILGSIFKSK